LPAAVALIVQVPAPAIVTVTVVPEIDTVQTDVLVEATDTVEPEDADTPLIVIGPLPYTAVADGTKPLIVWGIRVVTLIIWLAVAKAVEPVALLTVSVAVTVIGQFSRGAAEPTVIWPLLEPIAKPAFRLAVSMVYTMVPVPPLALAVASTALVCPEVWAVGWITGKVRPTVTVKL